MNDKSSRWQFTAYEGQYGLLETMPPGIAEWGWQDEICPTTQRPHRQGYLRLQQQQRFAWLRKTLPGIRVEIARNWDALIQYCKKEETRAPGAVPIHQVNNIPTLFAYADEVADYFVPRPGWNILECTQEQALSWLDIKVRLDIASSRKGIQWIASNPQWITTWNKYWKEMVQAAIKRQTDRQTPKTNLPEGIINGIQAVQETQVCDEGSEEAEG